MAILTGLLAGLSVLLPWNTALAAGVYVDAAGEIAFLTAPQARALAARLGRSHGSDGDANLYFVEAAFPLKNGTLFEIDIPIITFLDTTIVETGFGDVTLRARTRLYHAPTRVLQLTGALRTGTGTLAVWPYSSRSIDLQMGIAYVDTLDHFQLWVWGGGAYVSKEPEDVPEDELHGHYGRIGGGMFFPFASGALRLGAAFMGIFYEAGRSREVLLTTIDYRRSQWLTFTASAHAELGDREERVSDYAVMAGIRVFY